METFARQQEARRLSGLAFAIVGVWTVALAVLWTAVFAVALHRLAPVEVGYSAWNQSTLACVLVAVATIAVGIAGWRSLRLRRGGAAEAERLGAMTTDDAMLRDSLEQLCVTAGLPVPDVRVFDAPFCNAWSVGVGAFDAAVVLTRGALEQLEPDAIRALLAREVCQIADGTMLLNTRLACFTTPLSWLSVRARGLERRASHGSILLRPLRFAGAIAMHVLNAPAYAGARVAKAVVHRIRGGSADLAGMVLAGDADGVATALQRSRTDRAADTARRHAPGLLEYDHALFVPLGRTWLDALSTHPEFDERLRRIGLAKGQVRSEWSYAETSLRPIAKSADDAIATLDEIEAVHVRRGARILTAIPAAVRAAVRDPLGCHAVIATVLTRASSTRHARQRARFTNDGCARAILAARDLHDEVRELDPATWLALADLAAPALRAMDDSARDRLGHDLELLANGDTETLEFFVAATWQHALRAVRAGPRLLGRARRLAREDTTPLVATMLILARLGGEDEQAARTAFGNSLARVGVPPGRRRFSHVNERIVGIVSDGLARFARTSARSKQRILEAAAIALASDGALEPGEVELLRAIGKAIGCALPPQKDLRDAADDDAEAAHDRVLAELWTDEIAELLQTVAT